MATWTPPTYDPYRIGEFVTSRYGRLPAARQRALYNRFKSKGLEFGEDPSGLRQGLIRLTPNMLNRLPDGWGAEGVQNVGRALPQFDESKYEIGQNSAGRYFLRPLTELSGLNPVQVASIRDMDTRTGAQQELIKASYNSAADTAAKEAQDLGGRLAAIPRATGATAAPTSSAASTGAGIDEQQKESARNAQALSATRAAAKAAAQAPSIRQTGISQANQYATQAQQTRANLIAAFRASESEAAAAREAMNARLRGQDLDLLGVQLRTGGQISMNNADNARQIAVANANNQQSERNSIRQMQSRLAQIDAQIKIANARNDTSRATALARLKQQEINRYGSALRSNLRLVPDVGADGETPIPVSRQRSQLVQMLVSQGIPKNTAIAMARSAIK